MKRPPFHERAPRIYLVGFSGSGKSTIGPILANTLGYEFVDLDQEIQQKSGATVSELFTAHGEQGFRERELETLQDLSKRSRLIVSFGGGALTWAPTASLAFETGVVVYLEASRQEIINRLRKKTDRPLLLGDDGQPLDSESLRVRIDRLYHAREAAYREADIVVPTDAQPLGLTVDRIAQRLTRLLDSASRR
jgi:shikimate kinase